VGEISAADRGLGGAAAQIDLDIDAALVGGEIDWRREKTFGGRRAFVQLGRLEVGRKRGFLFGIQPEDSAGKQLDTAHAEAEARKVHVGGMGADVLADRLHQAPHIGVVPCHRTFEQRCIDDRLPERGGCDRIGSAADFHPDDVANALSVAHHVLGQVLADRAEYLFKSSKIGARKLPGGHQDHGIRCAGVTIDADAVEGRIDNASKDHAQTLARDREISEDVDQHRRQIRLDHPRALRNPDNSAGSELG
jgi:hypothetical protein